MIRFAAIRFGAIRFAAISFGAIRFAAVSFAAICFAAIRFGVIRFAAICLAAISLAVIHSEKHTKISSFFVQPFYETVSGNGAGSIQNHMCLLFRHTGSSLVSSLLFLVGFTISQTVPVSNSATITNNSRNIWSICQNERKPHYFVLGCRYALHGLHGIARFSFFLIQSKEMFSKIIVICSDSGEIVLQFAAGPLQVHHLQAWLTPRQPRNTAIILVRHSQTVPQAVISTRPSVHSTFA